MILPVHLRIFERDFTRVEKPSGRRDMAMLAQARQVLGPGQYGPMIELDFTSMIRSRTKPVSRSDLYNAIEPGLEIACEPKRRADGRYDVKGFVVMPQTRHLWIDSVQYPATETGDEPPGQAFASASFCSHQGIERCSIIFDRARTRHKGAPLEDVGLIQAGVQIRAQVSNPHRAVAQVDDFRIL